MGGLGPRGGVWGRLGRRLPSTGRGPAPPTHAPRQCRQSCHAGALSLGLVAGCRHPIPPDLGPSDNQICGIKSGPQIFPAPHHGQSQPTSSPQPPGPRGLAGPPAAPNPPRAWTGGLPPELQLGAGRPTSPTRQITYHLPGKAHLGASMGGLWGVAHRLHTPPTRRRAGNTKASPMHASYVCRVSRPRTEVVGGARGPPRGAPRAATTATRQGSSRPSACGCSRPWPGPHIPPTRQITYHLPGKILRTLPWGPPGGEPPWEAPRLPGKDSENPKASPMHARYACRVSRP